MSFPPSPGWFDRLAVAVKAAGEIDTVANGSGVPKGTIKRYLRGDGEPSAFKLAAIARFCGVTTEDILYGPAQIPDIVTGASIPTLVSPDMGYEEAADVVMIPLLDVIASAGPGISNPYPFEIDRLPFPRRWLEQLGVPEEFVQFIPIRGDSMEPTVRDGAVGLVDIRFQTPKIETIYVVVDDDDVRLKRIGRGLAGSLTLISDNERYPTDVLSSVDAARLKIAGRAFWAGGKI